MTNPEVPPLATVALITVGLFVGFFIGWATRALKAQNERAKEYRDYIYPMMNHHILGHPRPTPWAERDTQDDK